LASHSVWAPDVWDFDGSTLLMLWCGLANAYEAQQSSDILAVNDKMGTSGPHKATETLNAVRLPICCNKANSYPPV